ncbi:phage major capsid protein, P2 family [Novosphingobium guangzhouense]|uniref:Phage major capsid protein, P2 family n=1 Tax=Novosphingobium guangzhouense TaxID=1850347 RepID=A0A2K2G088_9SPHN|nr:phage major capsid protein, P2 family [Novosphingobium guangzhouense]PNU04456.1 phage major capsid protein, P2 family [Novosphingobium guangzhouense]
MQTSTRLLLNAFVAQVAKLNGLPEAFTATPGKLDKFNVSPQIEQRLQAKLRTISDFMSRINVVPVVNQQGGRVGVGVNRSLASRTNRGAGNKRSPQDVTGSDQIDKYLCTKTDYDYAWPYELLDAWAHEPAFQQLCRDAVLAQKAEDIMCIGFNGVDAAVETDREEFPLLQDVNYGWLHKIREYAPARRMAHGGLDNAKIYVSPEGSADYTNLDALVFDAVQNLMHERFRTATDLVVMVGSDLVHDKYFKIVEQAGNTATEQVARDVLMSSRQIGGKPTVQVPFFPNGSLLVTSFKNLSYYWQIGSARRAIQDNPSLDQIDNFESINDAFMVEEYGKCAFLENIELAPKA